MTELIENKYNNGLIYKLYCRDKTITDTYVGSTTEFWGRRRHHKCYSKTKQQKVYKFIRENGGWTNWDMRIIEYYPCNTKDELIAREGIIAVLHNATLNTQKPGRTLKQYRSDEREYINRYEQCICGIEYIISNRSRHVIVPVAVPDMDKLLSIAANDDKSVDWTVLLLSFILIEANTIFAYLLTSSTLLLS